MRNSLKSATDNAGRLTAWNTCFAASGVGGLQSGTISITTTGAMANASYAGEWANASGWHIQAGTPLHVLKELGG